MKDPIRLKDLILKTLDLGRVMLDYKVKFMINPMGMNEAQLRCPFHGQDNKPSARFYRSTQLFHCWVCQKTWNVISFVGDKEQLHFMGTLRFLVEKYKIDTSSIPDDPELNLPETKSVSESDIYAIYLRNRVYALKGKIPFERYRIICFAYYMLCYDQFLGTDILDKAKKLEEKLMMVGK